MKFKHQQKVYIIDKYYNQSSGKIDYNFYSGIIDSELPLSQSSEGLIRVKMKTLDSLLEESRISHVHFLSIDTEGFELNVLRGFTTSKYLPELIIIEDQGQSLANFRHLTTNGYRLVRRTGCNDWYVPRGSDFRVPIRERCRLRARILRSMFRELLSKS